MDLCGNGCQMQNNAMRVLTAKCDALLVPPRVLRPFRPCRRTTFLSLSFPRPSPQSYLKSVLDGDLPQNNQVLYNLQDIFNLLPNLNLESLSQSMVTKTSDMHLVRLSPYHYWRRCCVTFMLGTFGMVLPLCRVSVVNA